MIIEGIIGMAIGFLVVFLLALAFDKAKRYGQENGIVERDEWGDE